jgi:hypothetical protein
MIIDRRTFIQGSTLVASTSVLATLLPRTLATQPQPVQREQALNETARSPVVFKVDGWSPNSERPEDNEVLIRLNQSWRAAWR